MESGLEQGQGTGKDPLFKTVIKGCDNTKDHIALNSWKADAYQLCLPFLKQECTF